MSDPRPYPHAAAPAGRVAAAAHAGRVTESIADITERLIAEFEGRLSPALVSTTVLQAARDLADAPPGAWDEMVERAARQRLLEQTWSRR